jgi:plastocyanin
MVRLRRGFALLAVLLGAAAGVLPAIASSETSPAVEALNTPGSGLYAEEHHSWSPSAVTTMAGGVVRFSNSSEVPHGIEWRSSLKPTCEEGAGQVPVGTTAAASGTKWSGNCTFSQAGTYTFYCTVHGPEMTGTVTVSPDGTTTVTTQTPTSPPPTTTQTPTTTTTAPTVTSGSPFLDAPSLGAKQRGTAVRGLLYVSPAGAGDTLQVNLLASRAALAQTGHARPVSVGRLVRSSVSAGRQSFSVKLSASAARALRRHRSLALTVRITLTSPRGGTVTATRSVVLRA